jgi:hypothetical protein
MIFRRHLIQNKLIKALKTLGWLIRWAIQWFLVLATTAFKMKVAGIYPTNPNLSVRFAAPLFFHPYFLGIPSKEIASLRQHHAVRKYVPIDLNADNRSTPFRGNVHGCGLVGSGAGGPGVVVFSAMNSYVVAALFGKLLPVG